ncbi:MAG: RsmD family RNA methyltransferase [Deltaproteobacteria bacterium]|nr:RsmD family RNA methyltransferase [Deltaproteobacteria bacterium]
MLQVASGLLRRVPLRSPAGKQTRPSSERLRQGTFNVLRHFRWSPGNAEAKVEASIVSNGVIADLFAGTGAWGIEALSNGASEVWFVESHALALRTLQENIITASDCFKSQNLQCPIMHVLRRDVESAYGKLPQCRLIFCDPPYEQGWFEKVLRLEAAECRIQVGGLFLYEAAVKEPVPSVDAGLKHYDKKIYGDSAVHFFVKM